MCGSHACLESVQTSVGCDFAYFYMYTHVSMYAHMLVGIFLRVIVQVAQHVHVCRWACRIA